MYVVRTKRHSVPVARYYMREEAIARLGGNTKLEIFNEETESVEDITSGNIAGEIDPVSEPVSETSDRELFGVTFDRTEPSSDSTD